MGAWIIDLWNPQSDTCLLVPNHPTQIVVTRPDDSEAQDEKEDKKTTSPRSSSANNIYKMHHECEHHNANLAISAKIRNSRSCRKCSLFDFDCDAKEAKTVMKYLRFRKVLQGVSSSWVQTTWFVTPCTCNHFLRFRVVFESALMSFLLSKCVYFSDSVYISHVSCFVFSVQTDAQQRTKPLFGVEIGQSDIRIHLQYFLRYVLFREILKNTVIQT